MSELIVYGDFNCPYSRLASARIDLIERRSGPTVEFRAVEHDPSIPDDGIPVTGDVAAEFERELAEIRAMLAPEERDPLRLPTRRLNTRRAIEAYAAALPDQRPVLRERLFAAYWEKDRDISDREVLADLDAADTDPDLAGRWQEEWSALPRIVPVVVLPDGVSRGLGVLTRLGRLAGLKAADSDDIGAADRS